MINGLQKTNIICVDNLTLRGSKIVSETIKPYLVRNLKATSEYTVEEQIDYINDIFDVLGERPFTDQERSFLQSDVLKNIVLSDEIITLLIDKGVLDGEYLYSNSPYISNIFNIDNIKYCNINAQTILNNQPGTIVHTLKVPLSEFKRQGYFQGCHIHALNEYGIGCLGDIFEHYHVYKKNSPKISFENSLMASRQAGKKMLQECIRLLTDLRLYGEGSDFNFEDYRGML